MFQGSLKMGITWMFQRCFKYVLRIQGSFKSASKVFKMQFQKFFKIVTGKIKWCQEYLKIVFFLLLHGTHCSFLSRRRTCFFTHLKACSHKIFSNCRYDNGKSVWRAKHFKYQDFSAVSDAPHASMLLGPNMWTIYNDSKFCSSAEAHTHELEKTYMR